MENLDVMVLRTLQGWRAAGRRALLATVVRTWGSSPRPVGSIMALCEDGSVVGSVSGGCIEDDLIDRHTRAYAQGAPTANAVGDKDHRIPSGPPTFVKYGVTADEAHRFGLPCGGTLELLLEYDPAPDSLATLITALEAGRLMQRSVRLVDGAVTLTPAAAPTELVVDDERLTNTFGPEYRMLLIGAGQLAEYLATMALFNGFAVTVCDPREEYRGSWNVPAATVVSDMPDDVVLAFNLLHLVTDLAQALSSASDALKPGGLLVAAQEGFDARSLALAKLAAGRDLLAEAAEQFRVLNLPLKDLTLGALRELKLGQREAMQSRNMLVLGVLVWMYGISAEAVEAELREEVAGRLRLTGPDVMHC